MTSPGIVQWASRLCPLSPGTSSDRYAVEGRFSAASVDLRSKFRRPAILCDVPGCQVDEHLVSHTVLRVSHAIYIHGDGLKQHRVRVDVRAFIDSAHRCFPANV